ncbi:MAG TPA: 4-carboxymuconolactone decarboxylase [Solirubrobacteraceae bacterium]|nr:4-carboxymuconolactone decarboxylase [Solirubrobacteraceae bacterium]
MTVNHRLDGPDGAPVVMFANSLGTSLEMWDAQAEALSDRYRVLRFDHRGHRTVLELARDALALLDRLEIERVAYCGLSLGGAVGMTIARRAPERIERLALCATALEFGPPQQWHDRAATVRSEGLAAIAPAGLERWFTPNADPELVARFDAMLRAQPVEAYAACCEALADYELTDAEFSMPTLTIAGDGDPVTPPAKLAAIPADRHVVIGGARHMVNAEQPDAFNAALIAFLDEGAGMRVRRAVLGDAHVDRAKGGDPDFQDFITRYAWGEIWTRPGLDRRTRSAITITALIALGHENELAMHIRAALRNGLSADEIREVLLHSAIYCGVPAANSAFAVATPILEEGG